MGVSVVVVSMGQIESGKTVHMNLYQVPAQCWAYGTRDGRCTY